MKLIFPILFLMISACDIHAQEKIHFYEDTTQMRKEILLHVPIGSDTAMAIKKMTLGGFESFSRETNTYFLYNTTPIDFLFFYHDVGAIISMDRWKVAIVHKNGKVTDIQVQFVIIGL
jgi:hypothetical protein